MPAESKNQAIAARIALAAKKSGKKPKPGTASASMAKMPTKSLKHYTKAKKGAPKKKNESVLAEGNVGYEETRGGERYQMAVLDALQAEGMSFSEADNIIDIEYDLIGDCLYDDVPAETCAEMIMRKNNPEIHESYRAKFIGEK